MCHCNSLNNMKFSFFLLKNILINTFNNFLKEMSVFKYFFYNLCLEQNVRIWFNAFICLINVKFVYINLFKLCFEIL